MRLYEKPLVHARIREDEGRTVVYGCSRATPVNSSTNHARVNCVQCHKYLLARRDS